MESRRKPRHQKTKYQKHCRTAMAFREWTIYINGYERKPGMLKTTNAGIYENLPFGNGVFLISIGPFNFSTFSTFSFSLKVLN